MWECCNLNEPSAQRISVRRTLFDGLHLQFFVLHITLLKLPPRHSYHRLSLAMANNARSVRNQQSKTTGDGGSSSAQEPLTHLTCGPEGIAFAPVEDISKKLYEEYHALSARVALLESDSGKAKQDVDKRFKAVDKSIDSHSSTLTRLFREVRVLESVALKVRTFPYVYIRLLHSFHFRYSIVHRT